MYLAKTSGQGKDLSRETIKYAAAAAMLLDHIAVIFLEEGSGMFSVFRMIGGMTAVIMCFFLAEGFRKTSCLKKYGQRMLVFAVISQLPYTLAFSGVHDVGGRPAPLNILFNLFFCLCFLHFYVSVENRSYSLFMLCIVLVGSCFCDWGALAPCYVLLFYKGYGYDRRHSAWTAVIGLNILTGIFDVLRGYPASLAFLSAAGQVFAMLLVLRGYRGRAAGKHQIFHKWFFYLWYPLHLLILWIISCCGA